VPRVEIDEKVGEEQTKRLQQVRRRRDNRAVRQSLTDIRAACNAGENVLPYCIAAVRNLATKQEICDVYREVYGEYRDPGLY
jgi:methylmalonyl-CoA mutase, N-terminal domain